MEKSNSNPVVKRSSSSCIICLQKKTEGITICSQFICSHCEAEMIKTDVQDVKYSYYVYRMRKIWNRVSLSSLTELPNDRSMV